MKIKFVALLVLLPLTVGVQAQKSEFHKGVHYIELEERQPVSVSKDQIEVVEFFWYGCNHCRQFDPFIQKWKKTTPGNVKVKFVPVVFRPEFVPHARAYYAAEQLGVVEAAHPEIFKAIHEDSRPTKTGEDLAEIFADIGVEKKQFLEAYNSFEVDTQVRQAFDKVRKFKVRGVPSVAVNGQYVTSASMASSFGQMLKVMDHLIGKYAVADAAPDTAAAN